MRGQAKTALVLTLLLLALARAETPAQDGAAPGRVVFWSSQGPRAAERLTAQAVDALSAVQAERLLQELVDGPTRQDREDGLWTAIPEGTNLLEVDFQPGRTLTVRLDVPRHELERLDHASFEIIVNQIRHTLTAFSWRDLRVHVRDPQTGAFVALADFLPPVAVPPKPSTEVGAYAEADQESLGQPPARGQAQTTGSLSGKTVYVSAGHGWQWSYSYKAGKERWETQRPPYPDPSSYVGPIIEDHNNAEAVNQYLLRYLWNAGATVWPVRERSLIPYELVVDDDVGGEFGGSGWTGVSGGHGGQRFETETVTSAPTATATWSTGVPADGRYPVYVWYRSGADVERTHDARYTVHHAGGETTVSVDQRFHGRTWHYIGTYGFLRAEEARVTLDNQSSTAGKTVVADAVRLGGGTFDDLSGIATAAEVPPIKPWWEVASFYYTQRMGMEAANNDVVARPVYARWEHLGTGDDAVYVSWHSNGISGYQTHSRGTISIMYNGSGGSLTPGSELLRDTVHAELVHDIRSGWDATWPGSTLRMNLGELRELWDDNVAADSSQRQIPGALFEIAYHDHPSDTDALKEPAFNMLAARALYQGIVKYFERRDGLSLPLLPEPPTHLAVRNAGDRSLRISWAPSPTDATDLVGDPATGYRVYTSTNGVGWSNGIQVASGTATLLRGLPSDQIVFVRVTATNAGGESFPTETLGARVGEGANILMVNGFDRLNRTMVLYEDDPVTGLNARMLLDRMNSYDYIVQHGEAIVDRVFDSASNEAVQAGLVYLGDYAVVDWILGEESVDDETLDGQERTLLRSYLSGGGALFISGSEIGYHLDLHGTGADPAFYNDALRAAYAGDDAGTYQVYGTPGPFSDLAFRFDAPGIYEADYPDVLDVRSGSEEALRYVGGSGGTAAVHYANGCERVVTFGFPFETIRPDQRAAVMSTVMEFLDECATPVPETLISSPVDGSAHAFPPDAMGTAHAGQAQLTAVEVLIRHVSSGTFWSGSNWSADPTWLTASGSESWLYPLPPSWPEGAYVLRARARTGDAMDATPAEAAFVLDRTPPAKTTLVGPTGGITTTALPELRLEWTDVGSGGGSDVSYQVEVDAQVWTTSSPFYVLTNLSDGLHAWRVQVVDGAGNASGWTATETFVVSRLHAWLPVVLRRAAGGPLACPDLILNGGFELEEDWIANPEGYSPYSTDQARSGVRAGVVGYDDLSYSSVRQAVTLPAGSRATLLVWLNLISHNGDPDGFQYVSLWDEGGARHNLDVIKSNAQVWELRVYDVSDFLGQRVTVIVGAVNGDDGNLSRAYVDDVSLQVCP